MKMISTKAFFALSRRKAIVLTGVALLSLTAGLALAEKGGSKGKPGGEEPPPPNPAPVEYQLTWIPGINDGYMRIFGCNTAGIAVGTYADETGTHKPFCTTADGVIRPLENWWILPQGYEGWRISRLERQINEANTICGSIENDQTSEYKLFLANLSDPDSLEAVGPVLSGQPWWVHMNEHGDIAFRVSVGDTTTLHLYVRSLDKLFGWEPDLRSYWPTGINDNLQVSLVYRDLTWPSTGPSFRESGRLTFDMETETGEIEDLGISETIWDPMKLPWGGINNAGTVFGCFETKPPRIRIRSGRMVSRTADTTAGFIASGSGTWTELDARLPVGGSLKNSVAYAAAACALGVNEFGQVVGGYQCTGRYSSGDLWLLDPEDGLFDVDDLVVGNAANAADVEAFRSAYDFALVHITEIDPETGYGIISGTASASSAGFILTPRLIQQP